MKSLAKEKPNKVGETTKIKLNSKDPRDEIILENTRQIRNMEIAFQNTVKSLRRQFDDYVEQSTYLQDSMLERIYELKKTIENLQQRNFFLEQSKCKKPQSSNKNIKHVKSRSKIE